MQQSLLQSQSVYLDNVGCFSLQSIERSWRNRAIRSGEPRQFRAEQFDGKLLVRANADGLMDFARGASAEDDTKLVTSDSPATAHLGPSSGAVVVNWCNVGHHVSLVGIV